MTISELAKRTNVTTRTLRYYDSIDLLKPQGTTPGGHRTYQSEDIVRLQQIQFLQRLGFTLKEIKRLIEEGHADPAGYLEKQLALVRKERELLQKMEGGLTGLLNSYKIEGSLDWEVILEMVSALETGRTEMQELSRKWFGTSDMNEKLPNLNRADEDTNEWVRLVRQIQDLMNRQPSDPAVQEAVHELAAKTSVLVGNDEQLADNIWEVRKSPEKSQKLGWYPLDDKLLHFLDEAFKVYEKEGEKG